jgi:outer membrane receptor protein involved in Fe transport
MIQKEYVRTLVRHVAVPAVVISVQCAFDALAQEPQTADKPETLVTPEVEVLGHYELGIGTTDAASAGTVTSKRVDTRPVLRTGEVLEFVPGVIVTQHSGDGKANQYFLRGFNLDHGTDFAITVDGMPVNMRTHGHGQGYADLSFLVPELISRIDYRKGPYRAVDGDFSSAGAADIALYNSLDATLGSLTVGSFDFYRGLVASSPEVADGRLLYAFEYLHNDGPWTNPNDYAKVNAVMRYSRGSSQRGFSITGMAYDADWTSTDQIAKRAVDQGLIDRFGTLDPTDGGESYRYSLSASAFDRFDDWGWTADGYVLRYDMSLFSNFTYFLDDPTNGDQFEQADSRTVVGFHPRSSFDHGLLGRNSTTTLGLQFRHDDIGNVALYKTVARQRISTVREDSVAETSAGLYAENLTLWTGWFRSVLGVRADYYRFDVDSSIPANSGSLNDAIYSPKVALVFGPWSKTEYFANFGYGFHSNDARGTVIAVDPNTLAPADPVTPLVKTRGEEVGVKTEIIPGLQSTVALWQLTMDSELLFIGDAGTTEASRPSQRRGVEWSNHWIPKPWLLVDLDLSVSRARFTDDDPAGDYIPGSIEEVVSGGVTVTDLGPWFGSVILRYFGPRPLIEDNSVRSSSTTIVNFRGGYRIDKRWQVGLDVFNLFDSDASDIDYFYASCLAGEVGSAECPAGGGGTGVDDIHFHPVEPRSFRITLTGRF